MLNLTLTKIAQLQDILSDKYLYIFLSFGSVFAQLQNSTSLMSARKYYIFFFD